MFICISEIKFTQQPTADYPQRKKVLTYNFVHSFEAHDSWDKQTDKCKIVIPKNVYVRDEDGRPISLGGENVNIGGFAGLPPLFLRGDVVSVRAGYRYFDTRGNEVAPMNQIFTGYVSNVSSKKPIELECEDNMYILKSANAPQKTYKGFTVEAMLADMISLAGLPFTVNRKTATTIGTYMSSSATTIAQVLDTLRKDFHFESYFRGSELRCGSFIYLDQDTVGKPTSVFQFQKNIISDEISYKRLDDIVLSAIAHNTVNGQTTGFTKDGKAKTTTNRLEVLVTLTAKGVTTFVRSNKHDPYPANTVGDRRELYFGGTSTIKELTDLAVAELKKYYYAGLRGKFTTFGLPCIKQGDNIEIRDKKLPERNGIYKVKSVETTGGVAGLRQIIELDYRIVGN